MKLPIIPKVENVTSSNGNKIANQFDINTAEGRFFQSYNSLIAFRPFNHVKYGAQILLDKNDWDYSRTTSKYRNIFLGENKKETEAKIKKRMDNISSLILMSVKSLLLSLPRLLSKNLNKNQERKEDHDQLQENKTL